MLLELLLPPFFFSFFLSFSHVWALLTFFLRIVKCVSNGIFRDLVKDDRCAHCLLQRRRVVCGPVCAVCGACMFERLVDRDAPFSDLSDNQLEGVVPNSFCNL